MRLLAEILVITVLCAAVFAAVPVNPDSADAELATMEGDSALALRAEMAYARGLYHTAKDLAERIEDPTQENLLLLGQCHHVLARPHAARGYFSRITDPDLRPVAALGLAELYCGDLADADSCAQYRRIVSEMDYLSRFVELTMPGGSAESIDSVAAEEPGGAWTLQFGAFSMESLARQLAIKIRREGLKPVIVPREDSGDTLYIVYGGNFTTKGEAAARADAMAKEFACKVVEKP